MPKYYEYYQDRPSVGKAFSESFSRNWERSLENEMEEKRKARDVELQLRGAGLITEDDAKKMGVDIENPRVKPHVQKFNVFNNTWLKIPSEMEIADYEYKTRQKNMESPEAKDEREFALWKRQKDYERENPTKQPVDEEDRAYQREIGKQRYNARKELRTINEDNKVTREIIGEVKDSLTRIPTGVYGSVNRFLTQRLDPNDPINADYQKVRGFLTNQALLRQVLLKGATSDRDVNLVLESVAGKRDMSVPAILSVIDEAQRNANAKEQAAVKAYRDTFEDDPETWKGWYSSENSPKPGNSTSGTVSHPPVVQNGVTYTWNERTQQYE